MKKHTFLLVGFIIMFFVNNVLAITAATNIWNGLYTMPGANGNKLTVFDVSQQTTPKTSGSKKILFALTSEGLFFKDGSTVPVVGNWTKCSGQDLSVIGRPTRIFGPNSWYGAPVGGKFIYMTSDARNTQKGEGLIQFIISFTGDIPFCRALKQISTPGKEQKDKFFVAGFVPPGHVVNSGKDLNFNNDQWIYLLQRNMPNSSDALYVTTTGNNENPTWSEPIMQKKYALKQPSYFNDVFRGPQADSIKGADKRIYVATSGSVESSHNGLWSINHSSELSTGKLLQTDDETSHFPIQNLYRVFVRDRNDNIRSGLYNHVSTEVYVGGIDGLYACYNSQASSAKALWCDDLWQQYTQDTNRCGQGHDLAGNIITGIYVTGKDDDNAKPNIVVASLKTNAPLLTSGKNSYFNSYLDLLEHAGVYDGANDCMYFDSVSPTIIQDGGVAFLDISSVYYDVGSCSPTNSSGVYTHTHDPHPAGNFAGTLPTNNNNRSFTYGICGSQLYHGNFGSSKDPDNFLVGIAGPRCDDGGADYTSNVNL